MSFWTDPIGTTMNEVTDLTSSVLDPITEMLIGSPSDVPTVTAPTVDTEQLQANIQQQAQAQKEANIAAYNAAVQSQPGVTPYQAASMMGTNLASANQQAALGAQNLAAQADWGAQSLNAQMAMQSQLANQQAQEAYQKSKSSLWGGLLGGAGSLAAGWALKGTNPASGANLASSEEYKENVTGEDEPRVADTSDPRPQQMLDNFGNTLAGAKSVFTRIPGTPGYEDDSAEAGTIIEDLAGDELGQQLVNVDENGVKTIDQPKAIGALLASLGDAHHKINALASLQGIPGSTEEAKKDIQKGTEDFNRGVQDLGKSYQEGMGALGSARLQAAQQQQNTMSAMQQEQQQYSNRVNQLQQEHPSMSVGDIQSSLSAGQMAAQAFSYLAGGIAQGLMHSNTNPGVESWNRSVQSLIDTSNINYKRAMESAEAEHGATMQGLQAQYQAGADALKVIDSQMNGLQNQINMQMSFMDSAAKRQSLNTNAYVALSQMQSQKDYYQSQIDLNKAKALSYQNQKASDPLSVTVMGPDGSPTVETARSQKSAELLGTQLPQLDSQMKKLSAMANDVKSGRNLENVYREFLQSGSSAKGVEPSAFAKETGGELDPTGSRFLGKDKPEHQKRLLNAIQDRFNYLKQYRNSLLATNLAPSNNVNEAKSNTDGEFTANPPISTEQDDTGSRFSMSDVDRMNLSR